MGNDQYQKDQIVVMPPEPDHSLVLEAIGGLGAIVWRDHDGLSWMPHGRRAARPEDWANIVEYCIRYRVTLFVRQDGSEPPQ
jgi:hypothetical protein